MRKPQKIYTQDNHIIYGNLDSNNNKNLIIFVHGFTGNQNEHQYFNAIKYFLNKGFDTFRFDFYNDEYKARSLTESSLSSHSSDLENIISNFKGSYNEIFLVGHSLAGPVILKTNLTNISKIVFWDPTTGFKSIKEKNGEYLPEIDKYVFHWGMDIIVGKQMIAEWQSLDIEELINKLSIPSKFIFAGNYDKHIKWKIFYNKLKATKEMVIIKGASHCFVEEGTDLKLFEETLKWIQN